MAMAVRETMSARYELILKTVELIEKRIKLLPAGRVKIKFRNGKPNYYYLDNGSKEKFLTKKDANLLSQLLQKSYLKSVLKAAKTELAALEKMQEIYPDTLPEEIYGNLPDARKAGVEPIILGDGPDVRKWMNEPYVRKSFKKDAAVYKTLKGDRVRSKSEMIIADRLFINGIPYKYECPLMVGGEIIHPDFSIMRMSDHKIIYHEHCGKMDDKEYFNDLVDRINLYNQSGILQGNRLTFTFETSDTPFDARVIDRLINEYFK